MERTPTYYLPWIARPGLDCVLLLSNIEARFKAGHNQGPFALDVEQRDARGDVVARYAVTLADGEETQELRLRAVDPGYGIVTVIGEGLYSDLYVTLGDDGYAATHGRGEFVERYPLRSRAALATLGAALAPFARVLPLFVRHQYVYMGPSSRSHLLLLNLSNVTNHLRMTMPAHAAHRPVTHVERLPPMGARLVDPMAFGPSPAAEVGVRPLCIKGNAWFNLYLVGVGARGLTGPVSLMHVK